MLTRLETVNLIVIGPTVKPWVTLFSSLEKSHAAQTCVTGDPCLMWISLLKFSFLIKDKRQKVGVNLIRQIVACISPKLTVLINHYREFWTITTRRSEIHATMWQFFWIFFAKCFLFIKLIKFLAHLQMFEADSSRASSSLCIWWSCISRPYCISGCCQIACCCLDKSPRPQFWEWL